MEPQFFNNHRLDVISGTSYNAFDFEAYNKGLDECDRLEEGDYDSIGDILHWNLQDTITDLKYRAEEPYKNPLKAELVVGRKNPWTVSVFFQPQKKPMMIVSMLIVVMAVLRLLP